MLGGNVPSSSLLSRYNISNLPTRCKSFYQISPNKFRKSTCKKVAYWSSKFYEGRQLTEIEEGLWNTTRKSIVTEA